MISLFFFLSGRDNVQLVHLNHILTMFPSLKCYKIATFCGKMVDGKKIIYQFAVDKESLKDGLQSFTLLQIRGY